MNPNADHALILAARSWSYLDFDIAVGEVT